MRIGSRSIRCHGATCSDTPSPITNPLGARGAGGGGGSGYRLWLPDRSPKLHQPPPPKFDNKGLELHVQCAWTTRMQTALFVALVMGRRGMRLRVRVSPTHSDHDRA